MANSTPKNESTSTSSTSNADASSTPSNVPIITYPEFLTRRRLRRPSNISIYRNIVYILYISGGLAACILAVAQYIVTPMRAALTEARRNFAGHVLRLLKDLNEKVEDQLQARGLSIPRQHHDSKRRKNGEEHTIAGTDEDDGSDAGDATEFYEKDKGTQTTPALSRRSSHDDGDAKPSFSSLTSAGTVATDTTTTTTSSSATNNPLATPASRVAHHEQQLNSLRSRLSTITKQTEIDEEGENSVARSVAGLRAYLEEMAHVTPQFFSGGGVDGFGKMAGWGGGGGHGSGEDAAVEMKAEIRRVKGLLLSARNFPAVQRGRGGRVGGLRGR